MKIGVYFTSAKSHGGIYQYSITLLEALSKMSNHKFVVFTTTRDVPQSIRRNKRFKVIDIASIGQSYLQGEVRKNAYLLVYHRPKFMKILYRMRLFWLLRILYRLAHNGHIKVIEKERPDLMFYTASSNISFLCSVPSVVPIHDIMHREHPEFPEVSAGGIWEAREYTFQNIVKSAFGVLVDSEVGKEDLIRYYKPDLGKIVILPFLPPEYLDVDITASEAKKICSKLKLPSNFVFYPAKFWPHKNHENLIKALKILESQGKKVNLVLTGSKEAEFSNYDVIMRLIRRYRLEDDIFYPGYVRDDQISAIYKIARVMVMPDYFGPTNIPILEAWAMGTPAIASDVRGCRDQLDKAGLLVDPDDPRDIARKIWMIYSNERLADTLALKGRKRLSVWTKRDFSRRVREIIEDFQNTVDIGKKKKSCMICGSEAKLAYSDLFDDRYGAPGRFSIYRCVRCGFGRTDPVLEKEKISTFYKKYYPLPSTKIADVKRSVNMVSALLSWLLGIDNTAHRHVKKGRKVLDVGSGTGVSLLEIEKMGAQAYGVEPDPSAQRFAKKLSLKVFRGFLSDNPYPGDKFDYITASQVIEHEPDPLEFLRCARKKLRRNGHIILGFPNTDSIYRKIFGRRWLNWHVPYHVNFFTQNSLKRLAIKSGLKVVSIRTITPNVWTVIQLRSLFTMPREGAKSPIWTPTLSGEFAVKPSFSLKNLLEQFVIAVLPILITIVNRTIDLMAGGDSLLVILKDER